MKEIHDIVKAFDEAARLGKKSALATVVKVEGSSYRRPGARMLVTEDGKLTGAISGGCLEGDALRKAVLAIAQEKKKLVVYDTTDEEDAKLGIQLGCNGIVSILFEPIDSCQQQHPIEVLRALGTERKAQVLITGFAKDNNTEHTGTVSPLLVPADLATHINRIRDAVLASSQSQHLVLPTRTGEQQFFFEYCQPPVSLIIVGAGNDALPLHAMAKQLGWLTTVVDGRATHANKQRFADADQVIVAKPGAAIEQLLIDHRTAVVLMTHNYNYDLDMLCLLQPQNFGYLGMLGPASKRNRMLEEAVQRGIDFTGQQLQRIYGPAGLAIGAETAEQIAVSIIAEIMAVMSESHPQHLRDKRTPIHQPA
jgi:xanthine/CO dehydrogenase XdhC/CoxF family maturation factor